MQVQVVPRVTAQDETKLKAEVKKIREAWEGKCFLQSNLFHARSDSPKW